MRRLLYWPLSSALAALFLVALGFIRCFMPSAISRPRDNVKPRLLWGCTPILSLKYQAKALAHAGYHSKTFVSTFYSSIGDKSDFDIYRYEYLPIFKYLHGFFVSLIEPYLSFLYLLFRFDIFHFFYDGGILARTPLRLFEIQLLHKFKKKVVVMPYGGDVHVLSRMRDSTYRFGQLYHYGQHQVREHANMIRWIDYFSLHADCCIGSAYFDALYRWDILPVNYLGLDLELFRVPRGFEHRNDGKNGPVVVAHTPNHRMIKGTEYVVDAVERLRKDGYQVELRLLERLKNTEVREILEHSDILVELLVCGYGLSGIEGMALGKPVISHFQGNPAVLRHYSHLNECPIVEADMATVYEKLRWLVENPGTRQSIGMAGRKYVEKYHSYESQRIMWSQIYQKIWHGAAVDLMLLYHPLVGNYTKLYDARPDSGPLRKSAEC